MFRDWTWEELERAGLCDCGTPLASHPPLPKPKPLQSWNSRRNLGPEHYRAPEVAHPWGAVSGLEGPRLPGRRGPKRPGTRLPEVTPRMQEVARVVAHHLGNQAAAARELGISPAAVKQMMKRAREIGFTEAGI